MLKIGDKVKRNNQYCVPKDDKEKVYEVVTEPQEIGGTLCVFLKGYRCCYAVDGLTKVE